MLICSLPLSVFASEIRERAASSSSPVISITSLYSYDDGRPDEFRALPDNDGNFYLDIALNKAPTANETILVYYRTVDDSAVAEWGDYESVGTLGEAYVTLSQSNGYKARVIIKSKILEDGFVISDAKTNTVTENRIVTRRFRFELTRVEGNALLPSEASGGAKDTAENGFYCYLKAERYHKQQEGGGGYPTIVNGDYATILAQAKATINTPKIYKKGSYSDSISVTFGEEWKNYIRAGYADAGVALNGSCFEDFWNSDGPATIHLNYTYQGKKRRALSLYLEGEFDDSTYFGWQQAFDYVNGDYSDDKYYDSDVQDFMEDNFIGFTLYNNDGSKAFEVKMGSGRSVADILEVCNKLKDAKLDGFVSTANSNHEYGVTGRYDIVYLKLPSNYVLADSYSYEFVSDTDDETRWLENVYVDYCLYESEQPRIAEDANGIQMVTTNIDQIKDGDPLRMIIRFDKPVRNAYGNITLKINGQYDVTLNNVQLLGTNAFGTSSTFSWDTLVFEGNLPKDVLGSKITRIDTIAFTNPWAISSYIGSLNLLSFKIDDMYGLDKDLRTPVATVSVKSTESWSKSKSLDIYVNTKENSNSRFNDYVTVYYQWSNSKALPKTYSSSVTFHTAKDGEVLKTIIGTGSGETYLHIKAVSSYGMSSISDALTTVYDPNDKNATYTPFGPFKFDNSSPNLSEDDITVTGSLKERTISMLLPDDKGGVGLKDLSLYYIAKNGEETLLKNFTVDDFKGEPQKLEYTISHKTVGVGIDVDENVILERREVEFYWVLTDKLGNTSGKTAKFSLVFDTNDYIEDEITAVGPYDISSDAGDAAFKSTTQTIDGLTFIYDYRLNQGKNVNIHPDTAKKVNYGFYFAINSASFGGTDRGTYSANVSYKGEKIAATDYSFVKTNGVYVLWFHREMNSGRYDIQLTRTEGASTRVSRIYSVYATDGEDDATEVRNKIETGTLLSNSVYQLSSDYPYFYYKDSEGNRQQEYYNGVKQPATFSNYAKAKEYVYYKELSDIYLVKLTAATANALASGTTGYLVAKGETVTPREGQYWIRYKSDAWTPTSGDSSWVYYYYGMSNELSEGALSLNLQTALNAVANRIVSYGKSVILTDSSLFLGTAMGNKLLDEYGMPYLMDEQIHNKDEMSVETKCHNKWSVQVSFAADKNIYKSNVYVGKEGTENYTEYPIIGNFIPSSESRFQYMTYEEYNNNSAWKVLNLNKGETFIQVLTTSGVYYIREMSEDGVAVYAIYVDKEAPKVTFSHTDDQGLFQPIPVDGVEILDIRTKDLYIGSISATEYDRLSYVAVYKVSSLSLVGIYTANDLDQAPIKMDDGNYYIVVSDRSGNHYTVTAKVSSTVLECKIKETTDKFIKLTCNRKSDQILRYEVYLNGELVTSTYAAEQTFDKAGLYTIYIQDIYGNVFSEERLFNRNYPTVTWKYLGADGKYYVYDPNDSNTNGFIMTWVNDNQYKISTAVKTRFSFNEGYEFEFVGADPEYSKTIGTETVVTIEAGQSFTLKVYYKNHRDCCTIYSGVVDVTPPSINVSAEVDILSNGEYELFDRWLNSGAVKMEEIYYLLSEVGRRTVSNGGNVSSDIIKINATDANELSLIEVYLDGALIKRQDVKSGFSQIIVSKWGNYRIVAKDALGNLSEFTFANGMPDGIGYFVDGVEKELELHGYLNFKTVEGKHVYTKVDYGNTNFKLDINQDADVFMSVGVSGGNTEIYGFRVSDGRIYPLTYQIAPDKNGSQSVVLSVGDAVLDFNAKDFKVKNEYVISKIGSHAVYASISADRVVSIKVYASDDVSKIVSVNARIELLGSNTMFVSSEISKKSSNISFKELGLQSGTDVRANNGFTIDESLFDSERIASVSLYYSKLNDLSVDSITEKSDIYITDEKYVDEGFYLLIVRNRFGNEKVYRISILNSFGVTSSVTFGDGQKIYYSKDYHNKLYSNNEIVLDVLDEDMTYIVTLNGIAYTGFEQRREGSITYLVFSQAGLYEVKLTDAYGNTQTREFEINHATCTVTDALLTGYNEKALKRKEGYTNQKLTVDKAVYTKDGIYYLAIQYRDTLDVLFDAFAEIPIETDAKDLINIIGAKGDGVYTVICRNRFGSVVTKEIHYRSTPTLKLERTIRSKSASEIYDLDYAISLGFWSNNTLTFSTDAQTYVFTINGSVSECPRTLVFENAGDFGSFEYEITYIDEYGFEYHFKAYLVRRNVTINLPTTMTGVEVDGILNTKNDILITFGENTYATYTRNNGEEVIYRSGDILKKDGTYRFTVVDYAGNASILTIKKDTVVEFAFVESNSGMVVQNGSIVNSSKVVLNVLNKDSAYIEKILLNGVVQKDTTISKFTEDGKWELILCDKLGNKAYFCFYILTRSQNGFSYTTPYEYRITEMWYDSGDGIKVSYMSFVNHTEFTSSFEFTENGTYTVVMTSDVTGLASTFVFTINTNAPEVSLVGCNVGETTINDVTITGCKVGDRIKIYLSTDSGDKLIEEIEVKSLSTKMPTITEGGKYRIVVESEAGVATELTFVRKHVMNTAGSVFIMVMIGLAVVGLFTGLIYRNKSKTDD